MKLLIAGPGRAGGALALAGAAVGHEIVGVLSRSHSDAGPPLEWDEMLPPADLMVVAVTDAAITPVADRLAPHSREVDAAVHLSGFTSVAGLDSLRQAGLAVGSFHPLQTLPDRERGAEALRGSWAGITADDGLAMTLDDLAASLGMRGFRLEDRAKPAYHAAAAAASNYVVEALAVAAELFEAARVPFDAAGPLTRRVVENVFSMGPEAALTGPVRRGDHQTVEGQQTAAELVGSGVGTEFRLLTEATSLRVARR
ncbi:DUF2520 domain-containing protein [soil metagenome]